MRAVCFRACRSKGRKSLDFIIRHNTFVVVVCCIDVRFGTTITVDRCKGRHTDSPASRSVDSSAFTRE